MLTRVLLTATILTASALIPAVASANAFLEGKDGLVAQALSTGTGECASRGTSATCDLKRSQWAEVLFGRNRLRCLIFVRNVNDNYEFRNRSAANCRLERSGNHLNVYPPA